ncbi:MAG TPA: sigma-70 family RNA polymerase sigma factor [Isosphaeraceae bacterium]|jgi:RNA polymerase sigma-70 factor (ECF subfamily)|nr:sigma-70 family RNA polymerase sigma factor [Isosphaeraceae bacterium]
MADYLSDAMLLERFVSCREEAAFAALVERHGPSVLGACQRVLRNEHDAEDVLQATFLVLARKAAGMPWRDSVGGWLCTVAHRLALNARASAASRRSHELPSTELARESALNGDGLLPAELATQPDPWAEAARRELRQVVGDELRRLPEKYRAPVVLCYLEGKTNEEAARQLGWPTGSMSRRLKRARAILRQRLARRGLSLAIGLLCTVLAALCAWSVVPRGGQQAIAVREAMRPFQPPEAGGEGFGRVLASLSGSQPPELEWNSVKKLAARSAQAAERIKDHDPGQRRDQWRSLADEMRSASLALAFAAQEKDAQATVAAARQLNASCIHCHVAFRQ